MKLTFFTIGFWLFSALCFPLKAQEIELGSWNLEWLSTTAVDKFPQSERNRADFNALASYYQTLDVGVLAFQEVNDLYALRKVVGSDANIIFSERANQPQLQFRDINQYTGFVVAPHIKVLDTPPDLILGSSSKSKLRFASYIVVEGQGGEPLHLLSVHLKAGCSGALTSSRSCKTLKAQAIELNQWITQRVDNQQAFAVLGDFNHNLAYPNDWFWGLMVDGVSDLINLDSRTSQAICEVRSTRNKGQTYRYRNLIDHIVSYKLKRHSPAMQQSYAIDDVLSLQLSDHCPIKVGYH